MLQTSLLLMKSLNKTETPIFLSVVCSLFPKAIFFTFILPYIYLNLQFMILCLCIKFQFNTPIFSKDIVRKPFVLRTGRTGRTGRTICPHPSSPLKMAGGGGD